MSSKDQMFLSFAGADARHTAAALLHSVLISQGFNVFFDSRSIRIGHDVELAIEQAINQSRGAVIILSKNFAFSESCLKELELILVRKSKLGEQYVLQPIFIDGVDPDDLGGKLKGSYRHALAKHRNKYSNWSRFWNRSTSYKTKIHKWDTKVDGWAEALAQIARYKANVFRGPDLYKFIDETVDEIRNEFIRLGITVAPPHPNPDANIVPDDIDAGFKVTDL